MYDLLIAGGTVVDGTGGKARAADVAIKGGRIAAIGHNLGDAHEQIDASGLIVTPGFIDIHTHYDAQALWDSTLAPAVWHGVTTAITGSCGVGFAPARKEGRAALIDIMATVEDIPADALEAGLDWNWESYPDYMKAVAARPRTMDVGGMITHATLRVYVMGDRADGPATNDDIEKMAQLVREAMDAGALGLSTSRTVLHTYSNGDVIPGTNASNEELIRLATAVAEGGGLLEVASAGIAYPEPTTLLDGVDQFIDIGRQSGCPICYCLVQSSHEPDGFHEALARMRRANAEGTPFFPQVSSRPSALLMGFQNEFHPFAYLPSYQPLRTLPHDEKMAALRDSAVRARLLSEKNLNPIGLAVLFVSDDTWNHVFVMGEKQNRYPTPEYSIRALAEASGRNVMEVLYDAMMEKDGRAFLLYAAANWAREDKGDLHALLTHPDSVLGLGDAGAHLRVVCDASQPTTFLTDWVRDPRADDPLRIPIETAVQKLTRDNADLFRLRDRGAIEVGLKADINVIDLANLSAKPLDMVNDLPLDRPRLEQCATGYVATIVNGEVVQRQGSLTGRKPGRLLRGGKAQTSFGADLSVGT